MNKSKQKIILAGPVSFGIIHKISEELVLLGYDIQNFFISDVKFKYKNFGQRLYNLYRKTILRDYSYKDSLRKKAPLEYLIKQLDNTEAAEYALVIRPDMYPLEILQLLRQKVNTLVAYQWDGLNRYPDVFSYINLFDKFYIFDPADANYPNVLPTTNFHMNNECTSSSPQREINQVYYLGSFELSRWDTLSELTNSINLTGIDHNILVAAYTEEQKEIAKQNNNIKLIEAWLSYNENLEKVKNSSVLIDLQNDVHTGISFRIFEAIGYDKKVITTNKDVKLYDFYSPESIFVWENQSSEELMEFINAPHVKFPVEIKRKYSLNNWIKYMLELDNYMPIDLPTVKEEK